MFFDNISIFVIVVILVNFMLFNLIKFKIVIKFFLKDIEFCWNRVLFYVVICEKF